MCASVHARVYAFVCACASHKGAGTCVSVLLSGTRTLLYPPKPKGNRDPCMAGTCVVQSQDGSEPEQKS